MRRELLLEFFITLSAIEFALKECGYISGGEQEAKPDWDRFCRDHRNMFNSERTEALDAACSYLAALPPYKQVMRDGVLHWTAAPPVGQPPLDAFVVYVRRIRNNLFHGGKFNPADDNDRNTNLLQCSIILLHELLELSPPLRHNFDLARAQVD